MFSIDPFLKSRDKATLISPLLRTDNSNNNAVIPTAQTNKGIRSALMFIGFISIIVEIKFTAPTFQHVS